MHRGVLIFALNAFTDHLAQWIGATSCDVTSRDLLEGIARSRDYHWCAVITEFHFYLIIIKYKSLLRHKYNIIQRIGTFYDVCY